MQDFNIKIFADGADMSAIKKFYQTHYIKGFTTNPTLMRKAGIADYESFSKEVLSTIKDLPVSLEVFADDFDEIYAQAKTIGSWGANVYVKVPVSNTKGEFLGPLIKRLSDEGISLNVTALMTVSQVQEVLSSLNPDIPAIISVFAGRIADTGIDPLPVMKESLDLIKKSGKKVELLWASPRELLNLIQAEEIGCHIITVDGGLLNKLGLIGKDLMEYSRETVEMFYRDAQASEFKIRTLESVY